MSFNQFTKCDVREPITLAVYSDRRVSKIQGHLKWSHLGMKLSRSVRHEGEFVQYPDDLATVGL